jgi:hypothetical protein
VVAAMTHARELTFALAASATLAVPALAEDLDCRWFFPAIGRTLPVRCDEAAPPISSPAAQEVRAEKEVLGLTLAPPSEDLVDKFSIILQTNQDVVSTHDEMVPSVESAANDGHRTILLLLSNSRGEMQSVWLSLG